MCNRFRTDAHRFSGNCDFFFFFTLRLFKRVGWGKGRQERDFDSSGTYIVWKHNIYLYSTQKRKERITLGSLFFLFLKFILINFLFADNCICCLYIVKEDYLIHHIKLASHCQTIYNTLYQGFEISQWQPFFPFSGPCQDEPSVTVYDSLSLLQ